ncbi:MAG: FHA domain-containing protein [Ruminococcaceae bacterium]|nr:FHA domain-containing protein [Oscillospiraceae bacterium]
MLTTVILGGFIDIINNIIGGHSMNIFNTAVTTEQATNQFPSTAFSIIFCVVVIAIVVAAFGRTKRGRDVFSSLFRNKAPVREERTPIAEPRKKAVDTDRENDRGVTTIAAKYTCSLYLDGIKIASKAVTLSPEKPFFIGSARDDHLRVDEPTVSRHHLVVAVDTDGTDFIRDYGRDGQGSSNGTWFGGSFYRNASFDLVLDEKIYLGEEDGHYIVFERRKRQRDCHNSSEQSGAVRISR